MADKKFDIREVSGQPNKKELIIGENIDFTVRKSMICTKDELYQLYVPLREMFKDDE